MTLAAPSVVALDPDGTGSGNFLMAMPTAFVVFFVLVTTLAVAGFVYAGFSFMRNTRRLRQAGIDPMTAQAEFLVSLQRSQLLAGATTLEQRLAEVDRLYQAGKISPADMFRISVSASDKAL